MSECQYSIIEFNKIISGDIMDYLDRLIAERIDRDLSQKTVGEIINKSQLISSLTTSKTDYKATRSFDICKTQLQSF